MTTCATSDTNFKGWQAWQRQLLCKYRTRERELSGLFKTRLCIHPSLNHQHFSPICCLRSSLKRENWHQTELKDLTRRSWQLKWVLEIPSTNVIAWTYSFQWRNKSCPIYFRAFISLVMSLHFNKFWFNHLRFINQTHNLKWLPIKNTLKLHIKKPWKFIFCHLDTTLNPTSSNVRKTNFLNHAMKYQVEHYFWIPQLNITS